MFHQANPSIHEGLDIEGVGHHDDGKDFLGKLLGRKDDLVDAERIGKGLGFLRCGLDIKPAQETEGRASSHVLGFRTSQEIALVHRGAGDENVGVGGVRFGEGFP